MYVVYLINNCMNPKFQQLPVFIHIPKTAGPYTTFGTRKLQAIKIVEKYYGDELEEFKFQVPND